MRVFGIGIDVVEVERIASAIERHGEPFLAKLFTSNERAYCELQNKPALHYAARFAAKEAVSKALGTGIGGQAGWLDLEITRDPSGAPKLVLQGAAADFAHHNGITEIQISLTHAREYAAANAIAISNIEHRTPNIER
jgi:holo-[acyl-carrier protein] synthase